jgi:uncharacterized protein YwqG
MQLFVQLNSAELPQNVFGKGLLQVFYCTNGDSGCESFDPFSDSTLVRILDPSNIQPNNISMSPVTEAFKEKVIVEWQSTDDYPTAQELEELDSNIDLDDPYWYSQYDYSIQGDKLLGWPSWVQGVEYPYCPDCGDKMKYVFQIDSNDNLDYMFGDCGCAHITQCSHHPQQLTIAWSCC